jgi:RNA polymerase sigma factor (sigma-70 family)
VKLIRAGHDGAFEALFNRYHSRLLAFCQSMVKSRQDAEDVLQEVFANAHAAMTADERPINVRPWLYRIARNRCLNHLRKPVPEGQDSMDVHPHQNGTTTAEHVQDREELRQVLADVRTLPETQRTALLLREIDQLSYEEIAQAMDTTVPSVKSLLVRARMGLAESSKARLLTCGEVQVELAEAAEGITKTSGPARKHVRNCDRCREFRNQLRTDTKALAGLFPLGPLAFLKGGLLSKLFGGGAAGGSSVGAGSVGAGSVGAGSVGAGSAASGLSVVGSAIGIKAAAGMATAALLTAGAVEVRNNIGGGDPAPSPREHQVVATAPPAAHHAPSEQMAFMPAPPPPVKQRDKDPVQAAPPPPADAQQPQPAPQSRQPAAPQPVTVPAQEPAAQMPPPADTGTADIGAISGDPSSTGDEPGPAPSVTPEDPPPPPAPTPEPAPAPAPPPETTPPPATPPPATTAPPPSSSQPATDPDRDAS